MQRRCQILFTIHVHSDSRLVYYSLWYVIESLRICKVKQGAPKIPNLAPFEPHTSIGNKVEVSSGGTYVKRSMGITFATHALTGERAYLQRSKHKFT